MMNEHNFQTPKELREVLAKAILKDLANAIEKRGYATLLLSGGTTPKPLFELLSTTPFAWEKVRIGLCDERWVEPTHKDSNEKLIRDTLLQYEAINAQFVGLYTPDSEGIQAQEECSKRVKEKLLPIDVAILGMGDDAHTASLFPRNEKLPQAFDLSNEALCIAITPATAPYERMSLTLFALLHVSHLYLHFEGKNKKAVFDTAMQGDDIYEMPIRAVLHQNLKDIEVYYA